MGGKQNPRGRGRRAYGPVNLTDLDPPSQRHMEHLARISVRFAAAIVRYEHGEKVSRLSEAIGGRLVEGKAAEGLQIKDLSEGRTASGRVREAFEEPLADVVDLAVRLMLPLSRKSAIHEWIACLPVKAGRDNNAIGVDRNAYATTMAHVLVCAVGASDRQLLNQAWWLLTGTRDDHSSARADRQRIAEFEEELKRKLPGTFEEHLKRHFETEDRARNTVTREAEKGNIAFDSLGLHPNRFIKNCFPRCVILGSIPYGAPTKRGDSSAGVLLPGDDEGIAEAVEAAGRYGVALCELGEPVVELHDLERTLIPDLEERLGERLAPIDPERLAEVANWDKAVDLGIEESIPMVRYWQGEKSARLLRAKQVSDPDGGEGHDVHLWRSIGFDDPQLRAAVALIERAHQDWSFSCIARFARETQPGLAKTWTASARAGLLRASLIPSAAGACAHRRMERRRLGFDD